MWGGNMSSLLKRLKVDGSSNLKVAHIINILWEECAQEQTQNPKAGTTQ